MGYKKNRKFKDNNVQVDEVKVEDTNDQEVVDNEATVSDDSVIETTDQNVVTEETVDSNDSGEDEDSSVSEDNTDDDNANTTIKPSNTVEIALDSSLKNFADACKKGYLSATNMFTLGNALRTAFSIDDAEQVKRNIKIVLDHFNSDKDTFGIINLFGFQHEWVFGNDKLDKYNTLIHLLLEVKSGVNDKLFDVEKALEVLELGDAFASAVYSIIDSE